MGEGDEDGNVVEDMFNPGDVLKKAWTKKSFDGKKSLYP